MTELNKENFNEMVLKMKAQIDSNGKKNYSNDTKEYYVVDYYRDRALWWALNAVWYILSTKDDGAVEHSLKKSIRYL